MIPRAARGPNRRREVKRGSALLAVLGGVATLSCVALALAASARTALDRAALQADGAQAYLLARGGIEAALHELANPTLRRTARSSSVQRDFSFPAGIAEVRIEAESGKINVNRCGREALRRLVAGLGPPSVNAGALADDIVRYRQELLAGRVRHFDATFPAHSDSFQRSSFGRRFASVQVVEELLSLPGITPDLLYGTYRPYAINSGNKGLQQIAGLRRYLRTEGSAGVDINAASRAVLLASGMSATLADEVLAARQRAPLSQTAALFRRASRAAVHLPLGAGVGAEAWTITATGTEHKRFAARTVAATVEASNSTGRLRVRRWYERAL